jgi:hypothetical protein
MPSASTNGQPGRGQLSWLCSCGKKPVELKALGQCRACYDRRYHSLRFFGGLRELILERDHHRCRACGAPSGLVVHHRKEGNQVESLVTLCVRCHMRIHHSLGLRYWLSGPLLRLWREWHRREPVQLQLALKSKGAVKDDPRTRSIASRSRSSKWLSIAFLALIQCRVVPWCRWHAKIGELGSMPIATKELKVTDELYRFSGETVLRDKHSAVWGIYEPMIIGQGA